MGIDWWLVETYHELDQLIFWTVVCIVVLVAIRFIELLLKIFQSQGESAYRPGPFGALGPFFGQPAEIRKPESAVEADRIHAYKRWGALLSFICIVGGLLLFFFGIVDEAGTVKLSEVEITDAAPGIFFLVFGFLIWRGLSIGKKP